MTATVLALVVSALMAPQSSDSVRPEVVLNVQGNLKLRRGHNVKVLVRTDRLAFLTVYRVATDGRLSVLHPKTPNAQPAWEGMVNRGVVDPTGSLDHHTFAVDDYPGVGYVFAIASPVPFDYSALGDSAGWQVENLLPEGRVTGDADALIADIGIATLPDTIAFSYDEHRYLVEPTAPPIIAGFCPYCLPLFGSPFDLPIREWCATFQAEPPDPWTHLDGLSPPPPSSVVGGTPPPTVHPSDIVVAQGAKEPRKRTPKIGSSVDGVTSARGGAAGPSRPSRPRPPAVRPRTPGRRSPTAPRRRPT